MKQAHARIFLFARRTTMAKLINGLLALVSGLAPLALAASASGQSYPSQPINAVVGFAPGGLTDAANRMASEEAKKILKVDIVTQNKAGANTTVAISYIIGAKPDGYTIGTSADTGFLRAPHMMKLSFDPIADTTPIVYYARSNNLILVNEDSAFKTLNDLLDYTKRNPGKLTYGNTGIGSSLYLGFAILAKERGLEFANVVFPGDSQALLALLGGHVIAIGISAGPAMPQIKAGKIRALAIADGTQRLKQFPDVPTLSEFTKPENVMPSLGLIVFGPKNLPADIVGKIADAYGRAANTEAFKQWGAANQVQPMEKPLVGEALADYLKAENKKMGEIVDRLQLRGKF
jgi:tripartite-type tricarboxylate transporter receptor subunit TctC